MPGPLVGATPIKYGQEFVPEVYPAGINGKNACFIVIIMLHRMIPLTRAVQREWSEVETGKRHLRRSFPPIISVCNYILT